MEPGPQFQGLPRLFQGDLFHGTTAALEPGDRVLPPNRTKSSSPNGSRMLSARRGTSWDPHKNASASTSEQTAWEFADLTANRLGGRAAVYKVDEPQDTIPGMEKNEALSSEGFPVKDRVDIMPPESVRKPGKHMRYGPNPNGRQGTLPLDWTPFTDHVKHWGGNFTTTGPMSPQEANHPTQRQIQQLNESADRIAAAREPKTKARGGQKQPMLPGMRKSRKK